MSGQPDFGSEAARSQSRFEHFNLAILAHPEPEERLISARLGIVPVDVPAAEPNVDRSGIVGTLPVELLIRSVRHLTGRLQYHVGAHSIFKTKFTGQLSLVMPHGRGVGGHD